MRYLRGLRGQILLWTILPLIVILITVSFGSIALHQNNMRSMVAERNIRLVDVAAAQLEGDLQHRLQILQSVLTRDEAVPSSDLLRLGESLLSDFDEGLGLFDAQGNVRAATNSLNAARTQDERAAIASALRQPGQPVLVTQPAGDRVALVMALASQDGRLAALGVSSLDALHLPSLLTQLKTGERAMAWVLDAHGSIVSHSNGKQTTHDVSNGVDLAPLQRAVSGATFYNAKDSGDEHVIAYAPVNPAGWGIVIDEPWAEVIVPILRYTLFAPLLVLVAAIVSLGAVYFGLRRVIRPLQALGYRSSRLAWGDFEAIRQPVGGIGEIGELQRTLQQMGDQIQRYQAGMQDYIAALTQAQEEERRRLARDLHDDTVQSLVALSQRVTLTQLALQDAQTAHDADKLRQADERVRELSTMVTQTLQSVRQIIRALRPVFLEELGLVSGIEMLAQTTQTDGLLVAFDVTGDERRLPANKELTVYRLAQEGLNNVVRHAQASEASVHLDFNVEGVTLTISDNGKGFVPPDVPSDLARHGHFGLMGMYERASLLGGHISIRSAPAQGTKVVAFFPG